MNEMKFYCATLVKMDSVEDPVYPLEKQHSQPGTVFEGMFHQLPEVGRHFLFAREGKFGKLLQTSMVQKIESANDDVVTFHTYNSIYKLMIK